jgi:alpha-2-macroglobulin-like protein
MRAAKLEKELQVQEYILPALKMKLDFERKAFGPGGKVLAKIALNTNENKPLANYTFRYVANLEGKKLLEQTAQTDDEGNGYIRFNLPADLKTNDGLLNILIDYQGSPESISRSIPIILNKISFTMYPEGGDLVSGLASRVAFRALNEFNKPADYDFKRAGDGIFQQLPYGYGRIRPDAAGG